MSKVACPDQFADMLVAIDSLVPDAINARVHDDRNMQAIQDSLTQFGWRNVIVARKSDKMVLAGHGRVEAARLLGEVSAPVVFVDADDQQARAYALADNRTSELARWDFDNLSTVLDGLGDLTVPGFDLAEIESLLSVPEVDHVADEDIERIQSQGSESITLAAKTTTFRLRVPKSASKTVSENLAALALLHGGEVL